MYCAPAVCPVVSKFPCLHTHTYWWLLCATVSAYQSLVSRLSHAPSRVGFYPNYYFVLVVPHSLPWSRTTIHLARIRISWHHLCSGLKLFACDCKSTSGFLLVVLNALTSHSFYVRTITSEVIVWFEWLHTITNQYWSAIRLEHFLPTGLRWCVLTFSHIGCRLVAFFGSPTTHTLAFVLYIILAKYCGVSLIFVYIFSFTLTS